MTNPSKIALIGKGNVATHLKKALSKYSLTQIDSRILENIPDADVYIFAVKDDALPEVLNRFPMREGLFVHTAGSIAMDVFENHADRYGVLYPLQTFSKDRTVDFKDIPLFIETNNHPDRLLLESIANSISNQVVYLSSEKREKLHLSAVFANNFVNHMYYEAAKILEEENLSPQLLLPLIEETANKITLMHPREAQTGPAIRGDEKTMKKHLELLEGNPRLQELYEKISRSIQNK